MFLFIKQRIKYTIHWLRFRISIGAITLLNPIKQTLHDQKAVSNAKNDEKIVTVSPFRCVKRGFSSG